MPRLSYFSFFLLLTFFVWVPSASAERVKVKVEQENFRSSPNGKILAVVQKGTEFVVRGERGRWLRVQLAGWVWRPLSPAKKRAEQDATSAREAREAAPPPPVELLKTNLSWKVQDYHRQKGPKRSHLEVQLQFRNHTEHTLGAIEYTLQLMDRTGRVILEKKFDSDVLVPTGQIEPAIVTHRWVERGGPSGETYRQLRKAAEKGSLESRVDILSGYFFEVGQKPLQVNSP